MVTQAKKSSIVTGLLAGGVATICMTGVMLLSKRLGAQGEIPPKKIIKEVVRATGQAPVGRRALSLLTLAAHLGFGMGSGSTFAALQRRVGATRCPVLEGTLYGLGIWLISYWGWVPALGLMPAPTQDRPGRVRSNLLAHLVYGGVLGACLRWFETRRYDHGLSSTSHK